MAIPQPPTAPTKNPIDRKSVYIAAGLLSGIGAMISSTMPMVIGTMAETFEFSESQLGDMIASFNAAFTLIAIAALFIVRRINWKFAAFLCSSISVSSLFAITLTDKSQSIMLLFAVMGIGLGGLYALGMAVMGDSENPDRAFGLKLSLETLPSTILLFALPVLVIPVYGFTGMAYAMAAMCLVIGLLSGVLPAGGVKNDTALQPAPGSADKSTSFEPTSSTTAVTLSLLTLAAGIIFFSGILATWAFLEIIGTDKGLQADKVGFTLALSLLSAAVGAFVAAWLGNKIGRNLPLIAIVIVNIISLIILWRSTSLLYFAIGAISFTFCINYGLAYFFGLSAEVDLSGRFVVLSATTLSLGGVIGPAFGGRLMEGQGVESVIIFSALCAMISLVIYLMVVRLNRAR